MKCPKCGSEMNYPDWYRAPMKITNGVWKCSNCGHEEPVKEGKA